MITDLTGISAQLLQIEYRNLDAMPGGHTATSALRSNLARVDSQYSMMVISQGNHDAEALAFNPFSCAMKGHAGILVS